jgi:hypothetical protein
MVLLAGCTGGADDTSSPGPVPGDDYPGKPTGSDALAIVGVVHSEALVPLAQAELAIDGLGLRAISDAQGQFSFPPVEPAIYTVHATAAGYRSATLTARPAGGALEFILASTGPVQPYNNTLPFHGYLECAAEYLIITGPCDAVLIAGGQEPVFQNQSAFQFATDPNWATMVFDVDFDPDQAQAIDGLRLTLRGKDDSDSTGTYEQYGRFHDAAPFSFRVEPNGNYTDGTKPVPANATAFTVDVYPQGKAYHEVCDPSGATCFLGVGAATNIRFDVYVTVFYLEPAPAGFTLLGA